MITHRIGLLLGAESDWPTALEALMAAGVLLRGGFRPDGVGREWCGPEVLRGIRRTLKDDGVYIAQDIRGSGHHHGDLDHPLGPLLYTVSCMHCMTVSLAQGGAWLGAMWGRATAERHFAEAGFGSVEVNELDHDVQNYWYVLRP